MFKYPGDLPIRRASDVKTTSDLEHIQVTKTHITINGAAEYPYHIELHRCNTPNAVLGWMMHLSEKKWMTPSIMRGFIRAACEAHNIEITYS